MNGRPGRDDRRRPQGDRLRINHRIRVPEVRVIGDKEAMARTLSVRSRQEGELGAIPLPSFAERLLAEATPPRLFKS